MVVYDTVIEAINGLKARGFTHDLNIEFDRLNCHTLGICLNPDEFEIIEMHRFEGDTNPSDEEIVYAVVSKDGLIKGVLFTAFGLYASATSSDMMRKLSFHINPRQ